MLVRDTLQKQVADTFTMPYNGLIAKMETPIKFESRRWVPLSANKTVDANEQQ